MKTNFAVAALISAAAFYTPAQASTTLTTTLPAAGIYGTSLNLTLSNAAAGYIVATGYDGVFLTNNVNAAPILPAGKTALDVTAEKTNGVTPNGVNGLGLSNAGDPWVGPQDAIVLDFSHVTNYAGFTKASVNFNLFKDLTGPSTYVLWGMDNSNGTGTVAAGTAHLLSSGSMAVSGTVSIPSTALYASYVIGLTSDCSLDITSVGVNYNPTSNQGVPEPGTFVMAGMALIGLGMTIRKRTRA